MRARRSGLGCAAALGVAVCLALGASSASAEVDYCVAPAGAGAGQCDNPQGVATNATNGDVYVADRNNNRVSVFATGGEFLFAFGWDVIPGGATGFEICTTASGCKAGLAEAGAGQFSNPSQIAIDNSGGAEAGKVYVGSDNLHLQVQKFKADGSYESAIGSAGAGECQISRASSPIAIGPGGNLFVADSSGPAPNFTGRVEKFSPAGACLGETKLGDFRLASLAIDAAEDAFVTVAGAGGELRKYDLGAAETVLCAPAPGISTNGLAIDGAGHLFASQRERKDPPPGTQQAITEYEASSCEALQRFGYDEIGGNLAGLAPYASAEGDIYIGEGDFSEHEVHYLSQPPLGPVVVGSSVEVDPRSVKATVKAEVNPETEETSVVVDYLDSAHFESEGGFESPETKSGEAVTIAAGIDVKGVAVVAGCEVASEQSIEEGECLQPETEYHFRIRASNADDPEGTGQQAVAEGTFTTRPPIEVEAVFATEVGTDTAKINAAINPLGTVASGYFEYVGEDAFQESGFATATRVPDPEAGESPIDFGGAEVAKVGSVALYPLVGGTTYRYRLVANNLFLAEPVISEARSFTTFAEPPPTPCANDALRYGASALLPDCRAFEMVTPLDKANGDIVVLPESLSGQPATLNQAAVSGSRLAYGTYRAFGDAQSAPYTSQYIASRGGAGWQSHGINPPREGLIDESITQLFDSEFRAYSDDLCQGWIVPLAGPTLAGGSNPGYRNLYRREDSLCGPQTYTTLSDAAPQKQPPAWSAFKLELQGLSGDGTVAAFAANDSLAGSGAPANPSQMVQLYVKGPGGPPVFACVLPGGAKAAACSAGTGVSIGFGRGRFANVAGALAEDGSRLYWSNAAGEGKIYLRENPLGAGGECSGAGAPCTVAVSAAGEEASGQSKSHFWAAAGDGSVAVFSSGKDLYTYTVEGAVSEKLAGGLRGVLGASEDASRIYFVAEEALAGGAQAGKPNLYLYEAGSGLRLVGILASADLDPTVSSPVAAAPVNHNGRVSPSGETAAFMSQAALTGYDNADAASGEADTEVFVYDAAGEGELRCVSCNPSGARPAGAEMGSEASPFWVAARIPNYESTLYGPRVLAPDGSRLYFESQDPLVARDTNGRIDVYQWEQVGQGGCELSRATYSPAAGGCIDLISSGESARDSQLVDTSPSGEDVFFTTLSSLYPADYGLVDVYDARAGGGFPPPAPAPSECEGEGCQSPPAPPRFQAPSTATYTGPGNVAASASPFARCNKAGRRARALAKRAKRLRRAGARRGKAARYAKAARKQSAHAKRCRTRIRKQRRSAR